MKKLSESIVNNTLNPNLFLDGKLKAEVKEKILAIVDEFLGYAQVDIKIIDIRLVGSNAAYNYTPESDIDIHIVTDLSKVSKPETIARLYFDSVKSAFKDTYDIKIKGADVEIYVEDINTSANSNGIYSVTKDKWIKEPTPDFAPTEEDLAKAEEIEDELLDTLSSARSKDDLEKFIDELYLLRKDSLSQGGEIAPGNLAFKSLRSKGVLQKVKDMLVKDKEKELSLEGKKMRESIRTRLGRRMRESCDPFKIGKTIYKRSKYGVGKDIGGQIYFHKNYIDDIPPAKELYDKAKSILAKEYPDFKYNCLMYDKKKPTSLRFDEAPDFDTAREPIPGDMMTVNTETGEIKKGSSPQIWHHKWMWVKDDYKGFDVDQSYEWSKTWTQKITHPSGYMNKWNAALEDAGLPIE